MALNDAQIRRTPARNRPFKLFDEDGLFLLVTPNGNKNWRLRYWYEKKEKLLSLGGYPAVSLKDAREKRDEARKLLASDVDPSENRQAMKQAKAERAANSFEVVAREWFSKYFPTKAESHTKKVLQMFERDVFPWMGGRPIAELTPTEILTVIRRIEGRGALETAHRALTKCSQVFRYAIATGRLPSDPTRDLRGALPSVKKNNHFSAITSPTRLGELLRAIDNYQGGIVVRSALRLAPLVFVRPGELRQAEWKSFNLDACEWRFIVTKTNTPLVVPLCRQAKEILQELHPFSGSGRYVFPNPRTPDGSRPMSENAVLAALRNLGFGPEEMTGHGFRAAARTLLDEVLGFRLDLIEAQLAHSVADPLGRAYNRTTFLSERKEMMQRWADYLDGLKR